MKKLILSILSLSIVMGLFGSAYAAVDPEQDRKNLVKYLMKSHPGIKFEDYRMGAYNYSKDKMSQYKSAEEFPPYLDAIDSGEALYNKDKSAYNKCFGSDIKNVRVKYPYFDDKSNKVVTLEGSINKCRKDAGLKPFKLKKGSIAHLSAFYANEAQGQKVNVKISSDGARKAFEEGRQLFTRPQGQLNLSCAKCHAYSVGRKARANILSPIVGHTTGFPVFRAKWQNLGTLQRRYVGCHKNMRAKPFKAQGREYNNLEFFEAYMSNGLEIDGPSYRE